MADLPAKTEIGVTTGAIRGSKKVHVAAHSGSGIRVAMREIHLEGGEAPIRVYDTSGPYTDPEALIDINTGLNELRSPWIKARGDVEEVTQREVKPEDNGQLGPDRSGGVAPFPNVRKQVLRAKPGMNVSQMHYARQGIITPEMEYVAERENLGRARLPNISATAKALARRSPIMSRPNSSATKSPAAARSSPTTSTTPNPNRWRSAAISWSRSTPISATARSHPTWRLKSTRWSGRSAGARTPSWTCRTGRNIHDTREWIIRNSPVPIGTVPIYQALEKVGGVAEDLTWEIFRDTLIEQAEQGVDYFTIHAGVRLPYVPLAAKRVTGIVSRGGSIMAKWCLAHHKESFLYERFDDITEIMKAYDIAYQPRRRPAPRHRSPTPMTKRSSPSSTRWAS